MNSWASRASPTTLPAWCFAAGPKLSNTQSPLVARLSHNHSVKQRQLANSIGDTLRRNGYQALLDGGGVRDSVLGLAPADYDLVCDGMPELVASVFPVRV